MRRSRALGAVLAVVAAAACPGPRSPVDIGVARDSSVHLVGVVNGRNIQRCGGVWVTEDRFVTAAHCVAGATPGSTFAYARRGESDTHGARFLVATKSDVAVLQVSMPSPSHSFVGIVEAPEGAEAFVESHAYGYVRGTLHDFDTIVATLARGDSGSGVFVADGLVGIVSRRDEFGTEFVHAAEILEALRLADGVVLPTITPPVWEAEE